MTETFTWAVDYNPGGDFEPKVKQIVYGDGYEQRQQDGINNLKEVWDVSFTNRDDYTDITDFLEARNGVEAFNWTTPTGYSGLFVCRKWKATLPFGVVGNVSGRFEEVFE